jgi:hypothetical protein
LQAVVVAVRVSVVEALVEVAEVRVLAAAAADQAALGLVLQRVQTVMAYLLLEAVLLLQVLMVAARVVAEVQ